MPEKTYGYADVFSDGRGVLSEPFAFKPGSPDFEIRGRRAEGETTVFFNDTCLDIDREKSVVLPLDWGPSKQDRLDPAEYKKYSNLATSILTNSLEHTPYTIDRDFVASRLPTHFLTDPSFLILIFEGPLADDLQLLKKEGFVLTKDDLQTWICARLLDADYWDEEVAEDCKHVAQHCVANGLVQTKWPITWLVIIFAFMVIVVFLLLRLIGLF